MVSVLQQKPKVGALASDKQEKTSPRHPVLNEKAVSAAATRTCEMAKGTYFGDIRYRPFDQDLRTHERH